jgi:hypothetical protein
VTNTATNIESSAISNNNGDYEVPSLRAEAVAENITTQYV